MKVINIAGFLVVGAIALTGCAEQKKLVQREWETEGIIKKTCYQEEEYVQGERKSEKRFKVDMKNCKDYFAGKKAGVENGKPFYYKKKR